MKKILFSFFMVFIFVFTASTVFGGIDDFSGTWKNVDPNTGGITTVRIKVDGAKISVHTWGKCKPKDCDWGEREAYAYGPNASSNIQSKAIAVIVRYKTKFSRTILVITRDGSNKLKAEAFTRFIDNSGRSNYTAVYKLKRVQIKAKVPAKERPMQKVNED